MKTLNKMFTSSIFLPIILAITISLISALPLLVNGIDGVFFAIDPDVMYLSNALSYIKSHQIHYIDHPGTPSIILTAMGLAPLRLYAKFIAHTPFILWSVQNMGFIYFYSRLVRVFVFGLSTFIFLHVIKKHSQSNLTTIFSWLALGIFSSIFSLGVSISPEVFSFLIFSVWLLILDKFLAIKTPILISLLAFISGIALANKFTNFFLIPSSLALILNAKNLSKKQKITNFFFNSLLVPLGFLIGTWPIRQQYQSLFNWVIRLFTTTGVHGSGQQVVFSFHDYTRSLLSLYHLEFRPAMVFIATLIMFIYLIARKKINFFHPSSFILGSAVLGVIIFAKYPLSHYQLINYLLIIFSASVLIGYLPGATKLIFIVPLLFIFPKNVLRFYNLTTQAMVKTANLEKYIKQNPSQKPTLWEWGRTQDFALLWGRTWSGGSYDQELQRKKPDLLELKSKFELVNPNYHQQVKVFDTCWDKLYIQQVSAPTFLKKYSGRQLKYTPLSNTDDMAVIESNHCL